MNLDLGDVVLSLDLRVKGLRAANAILQVSAPRDSRPEDRARRGRVALATGKVVFRMDLKADNSVDFTLGWKDELGNVVTTAPEGTSVVFSVDDDSILSLVDDGAGMATVTPVGPLDAAHLSADISVPGRAPLNATTEIRVVAGDAEIVELVAGTPRETTPDV